MAGPGDSDLTPPAATVNGITAEFRSRRDAGAAVAQLQYRIPVAALPGGRRDRIELKAAGDKPLKIVGLEVHIVPGP